MCGINGFTGFNKERLRSMHAATTHRGPDDQGFFESANFSCAHNRLAIIDLSVAGHQPMLSHDGRHIVTYNGEIYNFATLRMELEEVGEKFVSQSDTEVLVTGLSRYGEDFIRRLRGIFAFAWWDKNTETLRLVRDGLGVKPLYYAVRNETLWFSSELKGLLAANIDSVPDVDSLEIYLSLMYLPAPRTIWRDVFKLPSGSTLTWCHGHLRVNLWTAMNEGKLPSSYTEAMEQVRRITAESVQSQLVSDRPVGIFLSGGIDSTVVLAATREKLQTGLKTFSVAYASEVDQQKYNVDAQIARRTASYFSTDHRELMVTADDVMRVFDEVIWHMDEPIANHVQTSTYLLAEMASREVAVVLGGDGGDELFGGYPRYWYLHKLRLTNQLGIKRLVRLWPASWLTEWRRLIAEDEVGRHIVFAAQKNTDLARVMLQTPTMNGVRDVFAPFFMESWRDVVNQHMATDLRTWLPEESLMRTDKMTMAHGLEARVPLLDVQLVDYAMTIPAAWKLDERLRGKKIFIDAWRDRLPREVQTAEKRPWLSPAAKWLRKPMKEFANDTLSSSFGPFDAMLDKRGISKMFMAHCEHGEYHLHLIWALLTLQRWVKIGYLPA